MTDASKLEGAALDAAVARALGNSPEIVPYRVSGDGGITFVREEPVCRVGMFHFEPSTDWRIGGPIIARERIGASFEEITRLWHAELEHSARADGVQRSFGSGPTPLIAAMRAFCASKGEAP